MAPVDAHERPRDYVTEEELRAMVESTKRSRDHWCDATMLMLMFYHGLRVSELCHLRRTQVDLTHGQMWVERDCGPMEMDTFTRVLT